MPEPLYIAQKSILKIAFGKYRQFDEMSILPVWQLYIKSVLLAVYKHFNNIFQEISHYTRYSSEIGVTCMQ